MKHYFNRLLRLLLGLLLFSVGIVLTMKANIGYAPWDAFHAGAAKTIGMSIGMVSILVGLIIVIITLLLGEKVGLGSLLNMVLIGVFIDLLMPVKLLPEANHLITGIILVLVGLFIIALGSYYYIGSGFGAGPRDSLMVALTRITKLPVGFCRGALEVLTVLIGWKLGGMIGIGTVITAFSVGICVQITFRLLKFNVTDVKHETLDQTYNNILNLIRSRKTKN